jgi:hypothetical protein
MPAPTAWPFALALGIALVFAGFVTGTPVSILGAVVAAAGIYGWFRDVLPHEAQEAVPVVEEPPVRTLRPEVDRMNLDLEPHRARLPLEIYPISAGIRGGLAGSVAMALLAVLFGVVSGHGIWYPVNLLAAGFLPASISENMEQMSHFSLAIFLIASAIHLLTSVLVGLLYGAMLPMLPRRPILLGGFIAPVLWSALIYSFLDIVNPVMSQRIDWFWFVLSQFGFGIVAGIVVSRQERVRTAQNLPFAVRAGMEASGIPGQNREPEQRS